MMIRMKMNIIIIMINIRLMMIKIIIMTKGVRYILWDESQPSDHK